MLEVQNISCGYDEQVVIKDVTLHFEKGKFYGILGPNGSGKSTLLKCMSGIIKPIKGEIMIEGHPLSYYTSKKLAQKLSVLPQLNASSFSNTVRETVALGRYPHQSGFFSSWSNEDEEAIQLAMQQTGITTYEHEILSFLSGGEQQRVFIAQALAQQAPIILLDEPTNHLDIAHQKLTLDIIQKQVTTENNIAIAVFHDINLASIYCDKLILLQDGEVQIVGAPHEVIGKKHIQSVYAASVATYAHPEVPKPQITMLPAKNTEKQVTISPEQFQITDQFVKLSTDIPLKVISSAVYNAGLGWFNTFINRTVPATYAMDDVEGEVEFFLKDQQFVPTNSVVMLTAVPAHCVVIKSYTAQNISITVAVTAGIGNAVDATKTFNREEKRAPGTINTWVFVNGKLSDEAYYQAMITSTEAKTKALADEQVYDQHSHTMATGTGTDSLLIAATHGGEFIQYAGPLTTLGKLIGFGVYETTRAAIQKYMHDNHLK